MIRSSHQDLVRALPGDKGTISHSLQTLEARGLIVIGRSPGGQAEALWLTPEGQKWASQLAGSCDEGEVYVETRSCGHEISCAALILLLTRRLFQNYFSAVKKGAECES
jgi:DNA-binding MarR family transcriptional regulator